MPLLGDRVQESTTTTGTGAFALNGAVTGYVTFGSSFANGDIVWYVCDNGSGDWEIGYGTYTASGNTLSRTVFQSSNANALVPFSAGTKRVFCTAPYTYFLPDQTGNNGKYLTTDGSTPSWADNPLGTVTTVSVVSTNGFAGTVANATTTPAITMTTTVTGVIKGNGTAISAATAGTDYVAPGGDLGTPNSGTLTNCTGLPVSTGISGLGTGVATALAVNVGTAGAPVVNGGALGTPSSGTLTSCTGLPISTGVSGLGSNVATFLATPSSANLAAALTDETGTGAAVFANTPTLVTPLLGTPTSGTLTNCTGLPISTGVSGLGSNVATFLATPSSANLASAVTDETGSGALVFGTNPTITNYTETSYSANSSTAITINLANGSMQFITLTGSPTITMPTASAGKSFTLILYTGTGSYTVSWSTVAWAGGTTPTITTTASKKDILNFYSDGTNWYGSVFGANF